MRTLFEDMQHLSDSDLAKIARLHRTGWTEEDEAEAERRSGY